MQMKKQNWKKLKSEMPCRHCGNDHETKTCLKRNGQTRRK
jgi:hypothetical protein